MEIFPDSALEYIDSQEGIDFEELLNLKIKKPARYIGNERGVKTHKWEDSRVKWALTYPELYEVGASNLGHIILYSILNNVPNQLCDRAYLPGNDLAEYLRRSSKPLFAVESQKPLYSFDIVGFSLSYELGATNILEMLDLAKIPLYSEQRKNLPLSNSSSVPIIFAGGPTATSNPEPYADFFDFIALGDGEELLPEIGLIIAEAKKSNKTRSEVLNLLSEIPGVYVPAFYEIGLDKKSITPVKNDIAKKITRRVATPMPYYGMGLVPNIETVHDRLTIEIRRGCTRGCRFCQPGMITRPARDVEPKEVINAVETGMEKTGYSDFSLLSLSCSDYLSLPSVGVELRNRLSKKNITLQLPSQRIDRFDDNIAHILGGARQASLTFAPEAGTQRLRDIVNKNLTDNDLLKGIQKAMENGFKKIKLYFMIGLPGENDDDVLGIARTCEWLQNECIHLGRLKLNITISNFTPKPHTPFQWHSVSTLEFKRRQQLLKSAFLPLKGIKINLTDIRISAIEDFIGRGDRELSKVIEAAWRAGAGMDAWFESQDRAYTAWTSAISKAGLEGKYRQLEMGDWNETKQLSKKDLISFCSQPLPWDHIDTGVDKRWLAYDLERALKKEVVPDCSFSSCSSCGVCGPELGHNKVIQPPAIPTQYPAQSPNSDKICRVRLRFTKTSPMHLVSHLDLLRIFERALRRSNLPTSYTGGFHPLPRLEIALALPLGIEAFGEWMSIDFFQMVHEEEVREKLQNNLPKGISLKNPKLIPISKISLSQQLYSAKWGFNLKSTSNLPWIKGINYLRNTPKLIWNDTDKKGRPRQKDYIQELESLRLESELNNNEIKLGNRNSIRIELITRVDQAGRSIKPVQIQKWLEEYFEKSLELSRITRDELVLKKC